MVVDTKITKVEKPHENIDKNVNKVRDLNLIQNSHNKDPTSLPPQ